MTAPVRPLTGNITFEGGEGIVLAADRTGPEDGPPVIFLHGGGQTRYAWGGTAQRIAAAGFQAFAVDQRGHGESGRSPTKSYAYEDFAGDVRAVARQVFATTGQEPAFVGASLGGISSLLACVNDPALPVSALVLVDITPWMNPEGVERIIGFMSADMEHGFATLEDAAAAIASYLPHRKRSVRLEGLAKNLIEGPDGRYRWHWDSAFVQGPRPIATDHQAISDRLIAEAGALQIPVHLVRGRDSDLITPEHANDFIDLLADGSWVDISGAGHMVAGDRNDIFSGAILDFLKERV